VFGLPFLILHYRIHPKAKDTYARPRHQQGGD
jgi:hypothetical protein